jgi:hypothetical protein
MGGAPLLESMMIVSLGVRTADPSITEERKRDESERIALGPGSALVRFVGMMCKIYDSTRCGYGLQ